MKITDITTSNNDITAENYENVFNIYNDENAFYYYDLLRKVDFPTELDPNTYDLYEAKPDDFYPLISYKAYNNIKLWWVICATNQIDNPLSAPEVGTILKIIKPYYVQSVLAKISE